MSVFGYVKLPEKAISCRVFAVLVSSPRRQPGLNNSLTLPSKEITTLTLLFDARSGWGTTSNRARIGCT
jgi:hypothetical protein